MANAQSSSNFYQYATVNAAPAAAGYATVAISSTTLRNVGTTQVFFSIRGTGVATVTLQYKCPGDSSWTDFADYNTSVRKAVKIGAAGVEWCARVKSGGYASGEVVFGFDW